jgi:hypothetical protein
MIARRLILLALLEAYNLIRDLASAGCGPREDATMEKLKRILKHEGLL